MWTNQMLKSNAKQFFMKNYWPCVGVALVLQFLGNSNVGSAVTCGIVGIFYVSPYAKATFTELYIYNRGKAYQEGYIH